MVRSELFKVSLRFGQVGLMHTVCFRISAFHFVTGYYFLDTLNLVARNVMERGFEKRRVTVHFSKKNEKPPSAVKTRTPLFFRKVSLKKPNCKV